MKDVQQSDIPSLRLIAYAVALSHHGSFTLAAQAMGVTQPTFSRGIAALERKFDARLFLRTSRPVKPTPEGTVFLALAKSLFTDVARLRDALGDYQNLRSGRVVLGVGPYALDFSVIECVARLSTRYPSLQIEIIEGPWREVGPKLLSGEVEIAVIDASGISTDPRVEVEMMPQHQGRFYCRRDHPLAGRSSISRAEIFEYPIVGVRMPGRAFLVDEQMPSKLTVDPVTGDVVPQIETTSVAAARGIVKRTDGIGVAAPSQIAEDLRNGSVVLLDADSSTLRSGYGIARLKEKPPSPGAQAFVETLKKVEAEFAAAEEIESAAQRRRRSKEGAI